MTSEIYEAYMGAGYIPVTYKIYDMKNVMKVREYDFTNEAKDYADFEKVVNAPIDIDYSKSLDNRGISVTNLLTGQVTHLLDVPENFYVYINSVRKRNGSWILEYQYSADTAAKQLTLA